MIRRIAAVVLLASAALVFSAVPASAANGNILCLWAKQPPVGLCIGL